MSLHEMTFYRASLSALESIYFFASVRRTGGIFIQCCQTQFLNIRFTIGSHLYGHHLPCHGSRDHCSSVFGQGPVGYKTAKAPVTVNLWQAVGSDQQWGCGQIHE